MRENGPDLKLLEGIRKFTRSFNCNVAVSLQRDLPFGRTGAVEQDFIWADARRFAGEMSRWLRLQQGRKLPQHKMIAGVVTIQMVDDAPHYHFALRVPEHLRSRFTNLAKDVWLSIRPSGTVKVERASRAGRIRWANYITREGERGPLAYKWLTFSELLDRTSRDRESGTSKCALPSFTGIHRGMSTRPDAIGREPSRFGVTSQRPLRLKSPISSR
jgi:hypothetical protein